MFCIAAFIVFFILAIFSASFRPLAGKAWHCVIRRVTLRPCDIDFSEEMKGKIIGKIMIHSPRIAAFVNHWIDWISFAFVALSIWSLIYTANAGLNLFVYDTCNPLAVESCSLGGEACGVQQQVPGLVESWKKDQMIQWATGPFTRFGTTILRIPDRLKTWHAAEFVFTGSANPPPAGSYDPDAPISLEVMDPLCQFCRKLYSNIQISGVEKQYTFHYLLYPIPNPQSPTGTKFAYSGLIARYLQAMSHVKGADPRDLIDKIFAKRPDGTEWQDYLRIGATENDVRQTMRQFLHEIHCCTAYTEDASVRAKAPLLKERDIAFIERMVDSEEVTKELAAQKSIVEDRLKTIKIPTILIGGRRFDRVIDTAKLKTFLKK